MLTVSPGVNVLYFNMTVTANTTRTHKRLTVKISNTKKGEKVFTPKEVKYVKQRLGWSPLGTTPPQIAKDKVFSNRQEGMPLQRHDASNCVVFIHCIFEFFSIFFLRGGH